MQLEYVCEDCGSLLIHTNKNTLDSMREIHNQLCVVKRKKLIENQKIKISSSPQKAISKQVQSEIPQNTGIQVSQLVSSFASEKLDENTTISLSGSGTGHSVLEGPIDTSFKSKKKVSGKFKGISVWGPLDAPGQLGIWGDNVCVDFDICIGDGACIDACPVNVYEWLETPGHPGSEKKPLMAREKDCIFCLACENVCPPQAIKIFQKS